MKLRFKKNILTISIITSLSSPVYAEIIRSNQSTVTVNTDGSFTISSYGGNIKEVINEKIEDLIKDENIKKFTVDTVSTIKIENIQEYIPTIGEQNVIENTLFIVENEPTISKRIWTYIYGGKSTEDVKNTNVLLTNGKIKGSLYGAYSSDGSAEGNAFITGGTIDNSVYGAYSENKNAIGNVFITGGNFYDSLYGAYSENKNAIGNVFITGGTILVSVYGAYSDYNGNVTGNVFITGGTFSDVIHGAYSENKNATGNVYISGGTVNNEVYGADSPEGNSTGNVYITGGNFSSIIYGAKSINGKAEGNVYLSGDIKFDDGYNGFYGATGKSYKALLSVASKPLTVNRLGGFTQYDFYLNENNYVINKPDEALLKVTGIIGDIEVDDNSTLNQSKVRLAGISKEGMVSNGSKIILIDAYDAAPLNGGSFSDLFETKDGDTSTVQVGLTGKADVIYGIDNDEQKVTATIDNYQVDEDRANKNLKPLAEGRLATLQNAVRGAEALQDVMGEHKPVGTFTPIAEISGGINQYSGSTSIESRDYRLIVGSRYQILNNLYTGVALDYGRSNYNSDNGDKRGEGNTYNYGASLFSKYTNSLKLGELYFDGALRFGKTSTEMKSNDVITSSNEFVSYKSKVNYFGTNAGLGFIYNLNKISSFDTSAYYFWTHLSGDDITIDGDDIHFKVANSSKIQFKEQYNYKTTDNLTFTLAGIYEYEFDSKAGASVLDVSIDAPSIKGSTRIVELGVKGTPIAENKDFNFNLRFRGYTGKRNGASASAFFEYDF